MISVAHAVTGSYIAACCPNPWIFVPVTLVSHFVLDYVHHYDIGVAMRQYHFGKVAMSFYESLDLLASVILIALIWQQNPSHFTWYIWGGALAGISPDLIETTDYFFGHPLKIFTPIYWVHEHFHHSTTDLFWGTLPQIILVSIIAVFTVFNW